MQDAAKVDSANTIRAATTLTIRDITGAITLGDLQTTNGSIDITADGSITALNVTSLTDNALNDIDITSNAGGIVAGTINAGTLGDVNLDAPGAGGAITDTAGKISANKLTANANGAMTLDTTINTIEATSGGAFEITETDSLDITTISAGANAITLSAGGHINSGTLDGASAQINAATIGITGAIPVADVSTLTMNLTSEVSGRSGELTQGTKLNTEPPAGNIVSVGSVKISGPYGTWDYLASAVNVDISAILASLATQSSAAQQLEALLDATTAFEFFMTPPLEIYIDMAEETEFEEAVDDSLDDDF